MGFFRDTLWTLDTAQRRLTVWGADGSVIRTIPTPQIPFSDPGVLLQGMIPLGSNRFYGVISVPAIPTDRERMSERPMLVFDSLGRTLVNLPPEIFWERRHVRLVGGGAQAAIPHPLDFSDIVLPDPATGTVVYVKKGEPMRSSPRVLRISPGGEVVLDRELPYEHRPLTDQERDGLVGQIMSTSFVRQAQLGRGEVRRALGPMEFYPPVSAAQTDPEGGLWLRRENRGGQPWRWDLVDLQGNIVKTVEVPRGYRLLHAEGNRFWVSWRDELDVDFVSGFRLRCSPPRSGRP